MTPLCNHIDCFETPEFDSIYKGDGKLCTKHAMLETESDGR